MNFPSHTIILKNLRLLLRTHTSLLVVLVGPVLLIILAGLAFNHLNPYAITIGTHSDQYNDVTTSFITKLEDSQFTVKKFTSLDECEQFIRAGMINACIQFSPDFEYGQKDHNKISFTVDFSKLNLVYTILNILSNTVETQSTEIRKHVADILIEAVDVSRTKVQESRPLLVGLTSNTQLINTQNDNIAILINQVDLAGTPNDVSNQTSSLLIRLVRAHINQTSLALSEAISGIEEIQSTTNGTTHDKLDDLSDELRALNTSATSLATTTNTSLTQYVQQTTQFQTELSAFTTRAKTTLGSSGQISATLAANNELLTQSLLLLLKLQDSLNVMNEHLRDIQLTTGDALVEPFDTVVKPISAQKPYLNYVFPLLLMTIILYSSFLIAPAIIHLERTSPARTRNHLAPIAPSTFFVATFLTSLIIIIAQLVILLAVSFLFFPAEVINSIPQTLGGLILLTSIFTLMGMTIGYFLYNETAAILASVISASTLLFSSGIIIPLESISTSLASILYYNPLTVGGILLRNVFIYDTPVGQVVHEINVLLGILFLTLLVSLLVYHYTPEEHSQ